jgi:hypothetical protein
MRVTSPQKSDSLPVSVSLPFWTISNALCICLWVSSWSKHHHHVRSYVLISTFVPSKVNCSRLFLRQSFLWNHSWVSVGSYNALYLRKSRPRLLGCLCWFLVFSLVEISDVWA